MFSLSNLMETPSVVRCEPAVLFCVLRGGTPGSERRLSSQHLLPAAGVHSTSCLRRDRTHTRVDELLWPLMRQNMFVCLMSTYYSPLSSISVNHWRKPVRTRINNPPQTPDPHQQETAAGWLSSSSNFQTCSQSVFTNKLTFLFIIFIYSQSFLLFNLLVAFNSAFFTRTNETVTLHRESTDWYGDNSHGLK